MLHRRTLVIVFLVGAAVGLVVMTGKATAPTGNPPFGTSGADRAAFRIGEYIGQYLSAAILGGALTLMAWAILAEAVRSIRRRI